MGCTPLPLQGRLGGAGRIKARLRPVGGRRARQRRLARATSGASAINCGSRQMRGGAATGARTQPRTHPNHPNPARSQLAPLRMMQSGKSLPAAVRWQNMTLAPSGASCACGCAAPRRAAAWWRVTHVQVLHVPGSFVCRT